MLVELNMMFVYRASCTVHDVYHASCAVHEVFYRASCAVSEVCFLFSFFRIFQFLDFRFRVPVYIGGRSSLNMIKENKHDYIQSSNIHREKLVPKHD